MFLFWENVLEKNWFLRNIDMFLYDITEISEMLIETR